MTLSTLNFSQREKYMAGKDRKRMSGKTDEIEELTKAQMENMELEDLLKYADDLNLFIPKEERTDKEIVIQSILQYFDWKSDRGGGVPIALGEMPEEVPDDETYEKFMSPTRILDFIEYFKEYTSYFTNSHARFKEACALFLISTMAKWTFVAVDSDRRELLEYLNLWFIFMGKSRISHKTTTIRPAKELVDEITERIKVKDKKSKKEFWINALLEENFTPEALASTLGDRCWNRDTTHSAFGMRSHGAWVNDEISGFFMKLAKQDYMSSTPELLSKIFDCDTVRFRTQTRGVEEVINPYLTMLVSSTEDLPELFTKFQLKQGFLNRPLYIFDEPRKMDRIPLDKVDERRKKMKEWLTALYEVDKRVMVFLFDIQTTELRKKFSEYETKVNKKIEKSELGLIEGYFSNLPNLLKKLAAIYRISRLTLAEIQDITNSIPDKNNYIAWKFIDQEDYDRAMKFLASCWVDYRKTVKKALIGVTESPVHNLNRQTAIVFEAILKAYNQTNKQPVSLTQITRKMSTVLKAPEKRDAIDFLLTAGYIEQIATPSPTGAGRPKTEYIPLKMFDIF